MPTLQAMAPLQLALRAVTFLRLPFLPLINTLSTHMPRPTYLCTPTPYPSLVPILQMLPGPGETGGWGMGGVGWGGVDVLG